MKNKYKVIEILQQATMLPSDGSKTFFDTIHHTKKGIHIGSFVLIFRIKNDTIIFEEIDHHDKIYKKKMNHLIKKLRYIRKIII